MNILIICAFYGRSDNANGICAKNIAESFISKGHNVWIISSCLGHLPDEEYNSLKITYVPVERSVELMYSYALCPSLISKILLLCNRAFRFFALFPFFPNNSPVRSRKVYSKARKLVETEGIDIVLATYKPYESIFAGIKLKEKYGDSLKVFTYHMDLMVSHISNESFVKKKFMNHRFKRVCKRENEIVNKVFLPIGGMESAMTNVSHLGFPVYVRSEIVESGFVPNPSVINISYVGSLDSENRNLDSAVKIIKLISVVLGRKVIVHIWGRLCDSRTRDIVLSCPFINYHGVLDNRMVYDILIKSDILLNIANAKYYSFIPSKIFQMFSTGKKIINIVQHQDDSSLPLFDQYPGSINIKTYEKIEVQVLTACERILDNTMVSRDNISAILEPYTPDRFCSAIIDETNYC